MPYYAIFLLLGLLSLVLVISFGAMGLVLSLLVWGVFLFYRLRALDFIRGMRRSRQAVRPQRLPRMAPPPPDPSFVGRERELEQVFKAAFSRQPIAIWGPVGSGRAQVVTWALQHRRLPLQYREGIYWCPAQGPAEDVVDRLARALGATSVLSLKTLKNKVQALKQVLLDRKILIVLAGVEDITLARTFCLEVSPQTIVTCLKPVPDVESVEITPLPLDKCRPLLFDKLPAEWHVQEADLDAVANSLARYPMAMVLAAGSAKGMTLSAFRERVQAPGEPPGPAEGIPPVALKAYGLALERLDDDERKLLALSAQFEGPFSLMAVEAVYGGATEARMYRLVERYLLSYDGKLYSTHPTIRTLARQLPMDERAQEALAGHFLAYARPRAGKDFTAMEELEVEWGNLRRAFECYRRAAAGETGAEAARRGVELYQCLTNLMETRSYWREAIPLGEAALELARRAGGETLIIGTASHLALAYRQEGRSEEAEALLQEAKDLAQKLEDKALLAETNYQLGHLHLQHKRFDKARGFFQESQNLLTQLGDQEGKARSLIYVGSILRETGKRQEANTTIQEGINILRELDDARGLALGLHQLGLLAFQVGQNEDAGRLYEESFRYFRAVGDEAAIADILYDVGNRALERGLVQESKNMLLGAVENYQEMGNLQQLANTLYRLGNIATIEVKIKDALRLYNRALDIHREIEDYGGIGSVSFQLGKIFFQTNKHDDSRRAFDESLRAYQRISDKNGWARCLHGLGVLAQDVKDYNEARKFLREGLALYRELGDQENIGNALGQLGLLAEVEGNYSEAERFLKQALETFEKNKSAAVEKCKQDLKRVSKLAVQESNRVAR